MIFQTQRLLLRELVAEDEAALHEIERDPNVTRYLPFDPRSSEDTRVYIETALRQQSDDPRRFYDFAIVRRDEASDAATVRGSGDSSDAITPTAEFGANPMTHTTPLIGRCGLGIHRPEHREAVIWYLLHPAHWGRGYAVEAASAVLDFGFGTLGLHRVWADCDPRNLASCRVAARLGMTLEGQLRENYFLKGEWCGTAVYAILESDRPTPREPVQSVSIVQCGTAL